MSSSIDVDRIHSHEMLVKEQAKKYSKTLETKINELKNEKSLLLHAYDNARVQLDNHYESLINTIILEKKAIVMKELQNEFDQLASRFDVALEEAVEKKRRIEKELKDDSGRQDGNESLIYEDALMINESVNEFSESSHNLEALCSGSDPNNNRENMLIDELLAEFSSGRISHNYLKLVKCAPDLSGVCFGHFHRNVPKSADTNNNQSLTSILDSMDHSAIALTPPTDNSVFKVGQRSSLLLSCAETNRDMFFNNLVVDLYDPELNKVEITLKERVKNGQRLVKVEFEPYVAGCYKFSVKYRDWHIVDSPFKFFVLGSDAMDSSVIAIKTEPKCELMEHQSQEMSKASSSTSINTAPSSTIHQKSASVSDNAPTIMNIGLGRGRLLKQRLAQGRVNGGPSQPIQPVAQKRKEDEREDMRASNHFNNDDLMDDMKEISNKLKKVVCVDESITQYRAISQASGHSSINSLMAINVDTRLTIDRRNLMSTHQPMSLISDHLRKYSNGLIRTIENNSMPNLQARFITRFTGCYFPIGVRPCHKRNWLIVCDSGNDSVKIFNNRTGDMIREIKEVNGCNLFKRPSAILIDPIKNNEIYVKDDKEIFVFDVDANCQLVRRFGFKMLSRPYGLAFDSRYNLVLVDADSKNPLIYTFDRQTGQILRAKSYKPVIQNYSDSSQLLHDFADATMKSLDGARPILSKNIQPFEKSKVRFICCNRDVLYASDLGRSLVFATDLDGKIDLVFGHNGRQKGQFNEPSGIHADSDGQSIMVGDSKNDRIQIYDDQGRYKCDVEFLDDKIIRPSDIHVDADGFLYVSCFIQHCVKKFQLIRDD